MEQATSGGIAKPLTSESERRIRNRRGQSFSTAEIRVANILLNGTTADPLFSPSDEKAAETLRVKFAKMESSIKASV